MRNQKVVDGRGKVSSNLAASTPADVAPSAVVSACSRFTCSSYVADWGPCAFLRGLYKCSDVDWNGEFTVKKCGLSPVFILPLDHRGGGEESSPFGFRV